MTTFADLPARAQAFAGRVLDLTERGTAVVLGLLVMAAAAVLGAIVLVQVAVALVQFAVYRLTYDAGRHLMRASTALLRFARRGA